MPATLARKNDDFEDERPPARRRRRRIRTLFTLTAPVALLAGIIYAAHAAPRLVYPVLAMLPDRLEIPVRAGSGVHGIADRAQSRWTALDRR
jgi:hypothetical protein